MENNKEPEKEIGIVRTRIPVRKIGGSYFIILDKQTRHMLHADHGTILGVKLWNIELKDLECPNCRHKFQDEMHVNIHDCPNCNTEFTDTQQMKGGNE